jgi:serine-type D-Ala-D-Ala endopeptidase (penicillin-binding protein 7)
VTHRPRCMKKWLAALAIGSLAFGLGSTPTAWAKAPSPELKKSAAQSSTQRPSVARGTDKAPVRKLRAAPVVKGAKTNRRPIKRAATVLVPAVLSEGYLAGLHASSDPLELKSGVALVIDRDSQEVLVSKNPQAILPIASITKLMTALVVVESGQSMDELIHIESVDADETMNRRSRLKAGTSLTRGEMLRLALMASENRAAYALSRHFPGGAEAFVELMNRKAQALGMKDTRFVEATGLSADNRSSAMDLARLVGAASTHAVIRDFSTAHESVVPVGARDQATQFRSTNGLIGNPEWDISLQKTGYISAAGRCLVMQASLAGRRLTMVLLDSAGKYSRFADAERIRQWLLRDGGKVLSSATAVLPKTETAH